MSFKKNSLCVFSWLCIFMNVTATTQENCRYVNTDFLQEIEQVLQYGANDEKNNTCLVTEVNAPKLYAVVKKLAALFAIPMPRIYLYEGDNARALSLTQTNASFEIGTDELRRLTTPEIEAIIAHELAHIQKYHKLKAILLTLFLILSNTTVSAVAFKETAATSRYVFKVALLFMALSLIEFPMMYFYKLAQEKEADLVSVAVTQNPRALLSAYKKFNAVVPNNGMFNWFLNLFGQHPSLEEEEKYLG